MRGVHSAVDDIRRSVFTEVARLAYESDDYKQVDMIPYKIVPGEVAHHRHDVFLERAIVSARLKLALGMDLDPNGPSAPISANIQDAATDQKYFNEPLVNIIPYACNACPPKQVRITDSCQGCISHPCMNVCPKDAIYLDENKRCHIDQSKCIKCGKCFNQCPYRAISKVERPCAAACGMDAIESDELGRAKINYDKCVSCGMCLVNCPFAAIADKSQIFQLIQAIKRGEEVIACVAPAFVGQYGPDATPAKLKTAMRTLGFADVVEVAIGADLCTVEEANDFLREVPEKIDWMGTSCCPAWSMMAKKLFPQFKDNISMALTPMVITARMVKKDHPNARIVFIGPCAAKKLEANRKSVRSDVDFVLTFEELLGMFDAKEIDFKTLEADPADGMDEGSGFGRGFAVGGGVAAAVVEAIKHIDPDMDAALHDLKYAIDNEVWQEWCEAVSACQTDRSLKSTLTPIVSKLSDMRVVNAELENLVFGPRKEFITMAILVLINIPLVRFINKDWYHTLVATIPGQMVIAVCLAAVFVSFAFVVKLTQPIEYRR